MKSASLSQGPAPWRSSSVFIVTTMAMALFTDTFLYTFIVPILPYMIEVRIGLDPDYTQRMSFALLSQGAFISVIASPFIGHYVDKSGTKRVWLLSSLVVCLVGTFALAVSMSAVFIFIARLVQALASAVMWVIGFSTVADNVKQEHLGKVYGLISVAVAVGTSAGPMLSGILFDFGGYWVAWSSAFVVILIDIVLRLLMLERPKDKGKRPATADADDLSDPENAPLLQPQPPEVIPVQLRMRERTGLQFYITLFQHRKFVAGAVSYLVFAILTASFDTTLPLHVRDVFGWGSTQTGLLFVALQSPGIPLSPIVGWVKDRLGTRHPITIGFLVLTPLVWLLGVPGDERFPWANEGDRGHIIYSVTVALIGVTICALNGAGTMEATMAVDEIESKQPGIFGPNGGYSRALSISSMGWTLGSFIGPLLSGVLVEEGGYYAMCCVLAAICLASSINAYMNLGATWDRDPGQREQEQS